jgi:Uma2 family endonuclease
MTISIEKRLLTVQEYNEMGRVGILRPSDKVELIHGEIIKMSPIGSKHANTVNKLNEVFRKLIDRELIISIQNPVITGPKSQPQPDISILNFRDDFYGNRIPESSDILLIVEVSDSSILYDREVKGPVYAAASIPEYWIIDVENDRIEVYSAPRDGIYTKSLILSETDSMKSYLIEREVRVKDLLL